MRSAETISNSHFSGDSKMPAIGDPLPIDDFAEMLLRIGTPLRSNFDGLQCANVTRVFLLQWGEIHLGNMHDNRTFYLGVAMFVHTVQRHVFDVLLKSTQFEFPLAPRVVVDTR
ncbi:hypothetical protein KSP40_PGU002529 [Platanthera guangdongensis]|uniref:Uncharacterized protein n=1 Tax=Platanthera guangdongensis TaxID=2320717 RepID=A0ABR2LEF1_9ASPA